MVSGASVATFNLGRERESIYECWWSSSLGATIRESRCESREIVNDAVGVLHSTNGNRAVPFDFDLCRETEDLDVATKNLSHYYCYFLGSYLRYDALS